MKLRMTLLTASALAAGFGAAAFAQTSGSADTDINGHPRINEIDQRLENQGNRVDNGVTGNQINAKQEMRDDRRDTRVSQELSRDEAAHGGHITTKEQTRMNEQLDRNSHDIHTQRHGNTVTPPPGQ